LSAFFLFSPRSFLFFFYCYGAPRDLHSFPTRRSSDLPGHQALLACITLRLDLLGHGVRRDGLELRLTEAARQPQTPLPVVGHHRSEEHTSELQSRFDLVCRLLLEKKKKPTTTRARYHR